ncbi:MAG TPA: hypothetical protein VHM19_06235 [Polyangiales bacterium]|nr:hypothetical protein [Polyangiales bacterium]
MALACVSVPGVARAQVEVVVVTRSAQDVEVARQLARTLEGVRVTERAEASARPARELVDEALAARAPGYVVVIDREGSRVHVLRPSDQTAVVRALSPEVIASSHAAVALSTAEMLDWLGASPPAPPPAAAPGNPTAELAAQEAETSRFAALLGAELEWRQAAESDASFLRPSFVLEGQLQPARWPVWTGLALRASLPSAGWERGFSSASVAGGRGHIEYAVTDATLSALLGHDAGALSLLFGLGLGVSVQSAELYDAGGKSLHASDRVAPVAALGLGVRHQLAWGLALALDADGQLSLAPSHYRVAGSPVLEEKPLRLLLRAGLCWRTAGL